MASATSAALRRLVSKAPVIFYGTVLPAVAASPDDEGFGHVEAVRIQVEHNLRGAGVAPVFVLRQWKDGTSGLHPGEHIIFFLHQPNAAGLTSPVFGSFGILRVGGGSLVNLRSLAVLGRLTDRRADSSVIELHGAMREEARCSPVPVSPPRARLGVDKPSLVHLQCGSDFDRRYDADDRLPEPQLFAILEQLIREQSVALAASFEPLNDPGSVPLRIMTSPIAEYSHVR